MNLLGPASPECAPRLQESTLKIWSQSELIWLRYGPFTVPCVTFTVIPLSPILAPHPIGFVDPTFIRTRPIITSISCLDHLERLAISFPIRLAPGQLETQGNALLACSLAFPLETQARASRTNERSPLETKS